MPFLSACATHAGRVLALAAVGSFVRIAANAAPASRDAFVRLHRCEVVARLDTIHRRGPVTTSKDRFIVVGLRELAQSYVQCIFHDRDTAMLCEASSGAYGAPADEPVRQQLDPRSVGALHALGYRQEDPRGNFVREIGLGSPPDLGRAADLMLAALHDAYGARPGTAIEITAPRGGPDGPRCAPPSAARPASEGDPVGG